MYKKSLQTHATYTYVRVIIRRNLSFFSPLYPNKINRSLR